MFKSFSEDNPKRVGTEVDKNQSFNFENCNFEFIPAGIIYISVSEQAEAVFTQLVEEQICLQI